MDELTNEEREALLRLIEATLQEPRYPLSPEVEALRAIADKLHGDERQKRAPRLRRAFATDRDACQMTMPASKRDTTFASDAASRPHAASHPCRACREPRRQK